MWLFPRVHFREPFIAPPHPQILQWSFPRLLLFPWTQKGLSEQILPSIFLEEDHKVVKTITAEILQQFTCHNN